MATVGIYEMTDTWNSGVTTYQGIKMTVTDSGTAVGNMAAFSPVPPPSNGNFLAFM